jgi:P4 family phage/plasmid primase-like protien
MGHGLDLVDVDPRNGGSLDAIPVPEVWGLATTPSAGVHAFVKSLGVRSRNNLVPGVDVKAGDREGKGRGFAFISPTIRLSKVTGEPTPYVWQIPPSPVHGWRNPDDHTGEALADMVKRAHGQVPVIPTSDPAALEISPSVDQFLTVGPWVDVEKTLAGGRNDGVMRLAAALRGEGGWPVDRAVDYMRAVVWPLINQSQAGHEFGWDEFEGIIRGVWERYPDGKAARLDEAVDSTAERPPALVGVGLLDAWIVDRIASSRLAGRYLWARGLGWMEWDGKRWVPVDTSIVVDDVRRYVQWLHASAAAAGADSDLLKRVAGLGTKARLAGLVELCRGVAGIRADVSEFDAHPDLLNCANGIVDLRTGLLCEHDPELRLTKITSVEYVVGAEHADWKAALEAVPSDVREWWQLRIGQAATGHMTPDDLLVVQVGGGENGKTTVMSAIRGALGEYYLLVSHRALLGTSDSVPTELMDFRGARLALLEETPEERRLAVTKLKSLVGTPEITARRMRQDPVTFPASHSLFISTNYLPVVAETDHGTWRRLACLRFPYRWLKPSETPVGEMDRPGDPNLRARLVAGESGQHEAILTWIVAGAVTWYQHQKIMPALPSRVESSTREWRASSDLVLAYVDERLEFDPGYHIMTRELTDDLNEWLVSRGHRVWSAELIGSRFGDHSEVAAHHVERIKTRDTTRLSRRPARAGMVTESMGNNPYWAWSCLKFRDSTNDQKEGYQSEGSSTNGRSQKARSSAQSVTSQKEGYDSLTSTVPSVPTNTQNIEINKITNIQGIGMGWHTWHKDQLEDQQVTAPKVTKSEAKRREKLRALADAAGEIGDLPALVDRTGTITPVTVDEVLRRFAGVGVLTVDVETSGYPLGHEYYALRTIQLGDADLAVVLDASDPDQREVAGECLAAAEVLQAHSGTADLAPLAAAGLVDYDEGFSRLKDTVIPAKLADPQSTGSDPGLKKLSEVVLASSAVSPAANEARAELFRQSHWLTDVKVDTPPERSGWAQVNPRCATMTRYAASDVLDTAALAERLPEPPEVVWERERLAQRMTARVAFRGLALDAVRVAELVDDHQAALDQARRAIAEFGISNPGSDKQVAEKLVELGAELPRTGTGRPSVARDAIVGLRDAPGAVGGLVRARLEFEQHEKLLSSFLTPYSELCVRGDGRVRPTVYTLGADTGRMSCVRPNLQQVPRSGGIRSCITADPGHVLISADFASVEVRVMAALSQDGNLMYQLANGLSVHEMISEQVFGPGWTKADKYTVKRGVFGWAYGGGIPNLAKQVGVSESVMASVVDVLKELAPTYVDWSANLKREVQSGRIRFQTYAGRIIHLDPKYPHKAPNYCVQGTARELLIDALIRWSMTPWGGCTLLPVHDELVVMVPEQEAEAATHALTTCMESSLFGVHIAAEASKPSFAWRDST